MTDAELEAIEVMGLPSSIPVIVAEVRRLRAQLATARNDLLEEQREHTEAVTRAEAAEKQLATARAEALKAAGDAARQALEDVRESEKKAISKGSAAYSLMFRYVTSVNAVDEALAAIATAPAAKPTPEMREDERKSAAAEAAWNILMNVPRRAAKPTPDATCTCPQPEPGDFILVHAQTCPLFDERWPGGRR